MPYQIDPSPFRAVDSDGLPLAGAKAYFYTSTNAAATVYADALCTVAHPTPVVANSTGFFPQIFSVDAADLRCIVTAADGTSVPGYPLFPVMRSAMGSETAAGLSFLPTSSISASNIQKAIEAVQTNLDTLGANVIGVAGLATGGGPVDSAPTITVAAATTADARAGTSSSVVMTPKEDKAALDWFVPAPVQFTQTIAATINAAIPTDGTTPQSSEGVLLVSGSVTRQAAANRLVVRYCVNILANATGTMVVGAFLSSQVDAIHAQVLTVANGAYYTVSGEVTVTAGATGAVTVSVRAGISTGTATSPCAAQIGVAAINTLSVQEVR